MGFSLRRKTGQAAQEYRGYLASPEWRRTRGAYFAWVYGQGMRPACQVCGVERSPEGTALDLHHMSYDRVHRGPDGTWVSGEERADLVMMCRTCHNRLHGILDGSGRDWKGWDRKRASVAIIVHLRNQLETGRGRAR